MLYIKKKSLMRISMLVIIFSIFVFNIGQKQLTNSFSEKLAKNFPLQMDFSEKIPVIQELSTTKPVEEDFSAKALDKKWTIMIYMDGDNNLEGMAIDDLLECEYGGGSNDDINVIVMIDRHYQYDTRYGDWAEARTYNVQPDSGPGLDSNIIRPSAEVDMGDGQTLEDFISFVRTSYPAENYYLDIWNHGSGIFGACVDDTDGGMLTVDEIQSAIKGATGSAGLDIISYDCCIMGTMEVAWEMADYCDYFIASEQNVPGDGFEYDLILNGLNNNPSMSSYDLSKVIVDAYEQKYSASEGACLSALNSTLASNLAPLISDFAGNLSKTIMQYDNDFIVDLIRDYTYSFDGGKYIDFLEYVQQVGTILDMPYARDHYQPLLELLTDYIAYNWQSSSYNGRANGVMIFMPSSDYQLPSNDFCYDYANRTSYCTNMDFQKDTLWGEYIRDYYDQFKFVSPPTPPTLAIGSTGSGYTVNQYCHQCFKIQIETAGFYKISTKASEGDVDLKVVRSGDKLTFLGKSYLVNPDDGNDDFLYLYLMPGTHYLCVLGMAESSTFSITAAKWSIPTLPVYTQRKASGGSCNGDNNGHFAQDLHHYYRFNLNKDNYTFILNNSGTANYGFTLYDQNWNIILSSAAPGLGQDIVLTYNSTTTKSCYLDISAMDGYGEFTIIIKSTTKPDNTGLPAIFFGFATSSILIIAAISKKRKD